MFYQSSTIIGETYLKPALGSIEIERYIFFIYCNFNFYHGRLMISLSIIQSRINFGIAPCDVIKVPPENYALSSLCLLCLTGACDMHDMCT